MSAVGTCNIIASLRDKLNIHVGINLLLNTFSLDIFQLNYVLKEYINPCKVKVTEDKRIIASTKKINPCPSWHYYSIFLQSKPHSTNNKHTLIIGKFVHDTHVT